MMTPLFKGFLLSLSLIVAIGAQNVFFKTGFNKPLHFIVCLLCFLCVWVFLVLGKFLRKIKF
ncbi:hypothetical protein CUPS4256_09250 [Campylobacter upsaliensis]|uniref:hypothetical protein n=1 Tax=Campylobacter upsaliensis TaxID=28080 RepID=UPI00214A53B5|nr:hypothetical protein [Campylobacter upsaliensis]MCR2103422.1 hypothetical protein [Campylobacter upsaliensis]